MTQRTIRLWPTCLIAGAALLALLLIWLPESLHRQKQVMGTMATVVLFGFFSLIWLLFLSRLAWGLRLRWFGGVALVLLLAASCLRVEGMSGDFRPILTWRWSTVATGSDVGGGEVTEVEALDWPQFLGPERLNRITGIQLESDWSITPPHELWRRPVGAAWSSFAVSAGRAVTQEQHGMEEQVVCYDLASGRKLWSHGDSARYETAVAGVGPRATPTIDSDLVFTFGATGILNALDLATGKPVWSRNAVAESEAKVHMWGVSCSPLVLDSLVVVSAGGPNGRSLVAYDRRSGDFVWGGGNDRAGFSSPSLVTLVGRQQILTFNSHSIVGQDPLNGRVLWRQPWDRVECVANPLVLPKDRVLVSSGYGIGSRLYEVSDSGNMEKLESRIVWESRRLKAKFANMVYHDGYVYGLDDGILACLDPANGSRRWKGGRYGHGQLILVGDVLLVTTEGGEVVLVNARPDRHEELARMTAFEGKHWNPPALAAPYLLVRTDKEAACYFLPLSEPLAESP